MGSDLSRYRNLAKTNPSLFENPSPAGFTIVLDERRIREVEGIARRRLRQDGHPDDWSSVGLVYEDQYIAVLRDAVLFPDGELDTYIRIIAKHDCGVAVLPILDRKIALVRHFRHSTRTWHVEIPRGFPTDALPPVEEARKELSEELGAEARRMTSLGAMHPNTGLMSDRVELFQAEVESIGETDKHEAIDEILLVDVAELERMIADSEVTDSFTVVAYARAKLRRSLPG